MGIFEKYSVRILGTPIQSIIETEDRKIFADRVSEIGEKVAPSAAVYSIAEVITVSYMLLLMFQFALTVYHLHVIQIIRAADFVRNSHFKCFK